MKINEIFILNIFVIGFFFILSSEKTHVHSIVVNYRGRNICESDDDCDYNQLCSIDNETKYCMNNCRYFHQKSRFCINPNVDYPIECDYTFQCADDKICLKHKHKCVNPCEILTCGPNTYCKVVYERQTACRCLDGYTGNPYSKEGCTKE